jgi:hypothetical protein
MDKHRLPLAFAAMTMFMFSVPAIAQSKSSEDPQPSGDWMERLESAIFDTPSTGRSGDGGQGSTDAYASTDADAPSAPQSEDEQDFENGRADLTGDGADDAPAPGNDGASAPDKYIPDAGDPDN